MKYLYPYECDKRGLSNPNELQAAIDSNRREGRRQSFGSSLFTYSPNGTPTMLSSPKLPAPGVSLTVGTNGASLTPIQKIKKGEIVAVLLLWGGDVFKSTYSSVLTLCSPCLSSLCCLTRRGGRPSAAGGRSASFASWGFGRSLSCCRAGSSSSGSNGSSGGCSGAAKGQTGGWWAAREEDGVACRGTPPTAAESPATQPAGHDRSDTYEHPHQQPRYGTRDIVSDVFRNKTANQTWLWCFHIRLRSLCSPAWVEEVPSLFNQHEIKAQANSFFGKCQFCCEI